MILYLLFIIIIFVVFFVLSLAFSFFRLLFRNPFRSSSFKNNESASSRGKYDETSPHKKVFQKDEGEYVDYENVE